VPGPIEVLVVDDSLITVQTITRVLEADPSIKVVGHALDGKKALDAVATLNPHVVTMDINMPVMDGIEATRHIVRNHGTPIVIVSAYASARSVAIQTMQALLQGAIESVQKPSGEIGLDLDMVGAEMIAKIKAASRARPRTAISAQAAEAARVTGAPMSWRSMPAGGTEFVAIGVSTGGPSTLEKFIPQIPADYPLPIALVIHMPEVFIPILASNLDSRSAIKVAVAQDGQALVPGQMLICPAGVHMKVTRDLSVRLEPGAPVNGCLPAVDVLFESIARGVQKRCLGLVLTGMGRDGTKGLQAMRERNHVTAAQDESTSVVWGMPRAALSSGAAAYEVSLGDMNRMLARTAGRV